LSALFSFAEGLGVIVLIGVVGVIGILRIIGVL
jgi:hypothetical protein